jgi:hypothetical protein
MEIASVNFKHLLDLTRAVAENVTVDPLAGIEPVQGVWVITLVYT